MLRLLVMTAILPFSLTVSAAPEPATSRPAYVPGQVIVAFQPGVAASAVADAHRAAGAVPLRSLTAIGAQVMQVAKGSESAAITSYQKNPNVRYAEPNYIRPLFIPNEGDDPPPPLGFGVSYFDEQWGMNNTGQSFYINPYTFQHGVLTGEPDADMDLPEAWELTRGDPSVVVAVLDSGVECTHADLRGKCVESVNLGPSTDELDQLGHGTHVAGIIAAAFDNNIGVAGVGGDVSIASFKVCYEDYDLYTGLVVGYCDAAASAAGMIRAADSGYQVVNMSYAGPVGSQAEADAAAYAAAQGVLLVAAAANNYVRDRMYPAAFPEVMAVAASDYFDNLAGFSNFGNDWVSVGAPGDVIFSTVPHAACLAPLDDPEGCYDWYSGTSMASPHVAGLAALVFSYQGVGATPASVRAAIENGADTVGALGQNWLAWTEHGRVNALAALEGGAPPPPPPTGEGVHVGDLDGVRVNMGAQWAGRVTVSVHDSSDLPVRNASVSGSWSGGTTGPFACTTGSNGTCQADSPGMPKKTAGVTLTIANVSAAEAYSSIDNHDPDGDSDGTTITLAK